VQRDEIAAFESRSGGDVYHSVPPTLGSDGLRDTGSGAYSVQHTVASVDSEASSCVLKVMFQLNLTKNSGIIRRLKSIEPATLHKKVLQELGHKKQMSKEEFVHLMQKVLKDDFINRRDCLTLFSVFDDDKSGLVDAVEFVSGFISLVTAGENDIAYKFIHTILDARGEKNIVNALISRFELQLLVSAAQHHYRREPEIVALLGKVPNMFNFSFHLGRIPILELRDAIARNSDLHAVFTALPNPSGRVRDAATSAVQQQQALFAESLASAAAEDRHFADLLVADQWMCADERKQAAAEEHGAPKWYCSGVTVYRQVCDQPPQPVFMRDLDRKR